MLKDIAHVVVVVVSSNTAATLIALFAVVVACATLGKQVGGLLRANGLSPEMPEYGVTGCMVFPIAAGIFLLVTFLIYWALRGDLGLRGDDTYAEVRLFALVAIGLNGVLGLVSNRFGRGSSPRNDDETTGSRPRGPLAFLWSKVLYWFNTGASAVTIVGFYIDHLASAPK